MSNTNEDSQQFRLLVDNACDHVIFSTDVSGTITTWNPGVGNILGYEEQEWVGQPAHIIFTPEDRAENVPEREMAGAREKGRTDDIRWHLRKDGTRFWAEGSMVALRDEAGTLHGFGKIMRDATERKLSEERRWSRLTEIFMQAPAFMATLRGPQHIFDLANPTYYQLVGYRDIIGRPVAEALPEVVEQGFIDLLDHVYQTGEPFIGKDVAISLQPDPEGPLEERFLDFTYQRLVDTDGTVSGILAHGIDLTDRKKLATEREGLLVEARAQAEREALLNQIGTEVRQTLEPEAILQGVVTALGQGLGVDRCYFVRYDQARDAAQVTPEWIRPETDTEPLAGKTFRMSAYSVDRDAAFKAGRTHVIDDVIAYDPADASPLLALNIRAMMRVPIAVGNHMTALTVAMSHEPRHWTKDEVRLIENVAALVRSTLESAQVLERERNISQQLQNALVPPVPQSLPGMRLASFYRPALQEANVGGDFFDVFPIDPDCTVLIVADLSGKGLHAASEVATCRNMVRHALYSAASSAANSAATIAEAITALNELLVRYNLLTGFATAFLGVYDHAVQTLTYVNCGQEPGLLWRVRSGEIEELRPTGPVLGGFGEGDYEEATVQLSDGDVLALFTDGMTEVGPNRRELLEIEGVTRLLLEHCAKTPKGGHDPHSIKDCLIADVDVFARGGVGDDIALLVGVVEGAERNSKIRVI